MTGPASTTGRPRRRSFASSEMDYEQVARELGVRYCDGLAEGQEGPDRRHGPGYVTHLWGQPMVHWRPRRMSRRGLYLFLRLASQALYPDDTVRQERWLALFRQDQHARRLALKLGVRIPAEYGRREKARVRLDLATIGPLDTEFPEQRQLIRRVQAWTRT